MSTTTRTRLYMFDTTLRDGMQRMDMDSSLLQKQQLARLFDEMGIDYVEGGFPGSNPTDTEFFQSDLGLKTSRLTAFGKTAMVGKSPQNDPSLAELFNAKAKHVCLVAKSSLKHVYKALQVQPEDNLDSIRKSVKAFIANGQEAMIDLEHAIDSYKEDKDYFLAAAKAAYDSGARWIVLCDTNGGRTHEEVGEAVRFLIDNGLSGDRLGIHAHGDVEMAVSNSYEAVRAGVRMVQGTMTGIGERCGNANLTTLIPLLHTKGYDCGVTAETLAQWKPYAERINHILNLPDNPYAPYVGQNAFATKAGIHASAMAKQEAGEFLYSHIDPSLVGNREVIAGASTQSGMSNLKTKLGEMGIEYNAADPRWKMLIQDINERSKLGFAYEMAEASLENLIHRANGTPVHYFELVKSHIEMKSKETAPGVMTSVAEAHVAVKVGANVYHGKSEGHGPVHALDLAMRPILSQVPGYESLNDVHVASDFRVQIINQLDTDSITRVRLDCKNGDNVTWTTVGASKNIIDASTIAYTEALRWKLNKERAPDYMAAPQVSAPAYRVSA